MKITSLQLQSLKLLLSHRSRPLTAMDFFKGSRAKYLLAAGPLGITALMVNGWTLLGMFLGGYLVGVLLCDFMWVRKQMLVLPVTSEITNWERVEQLIREHEAAQA